MSEKPDFENLIALLDMAKSVIAMLAEEERKRLINAMLDAYLLPEQNHPDEELPAQDESETSDEQDLLFEEVLNILGSNSMTSFEISEELHGRGYDLLEEEVSRLLMSKEGKDVVISFHIPVDYSRLSAKNRNRMRGKQAKTMRVFQNLREHRRSTSRFKSDQAGVSLEDFKAVMRDDWLTRNEIIERLRNERGVVIKSTDMAKIMNASPVSSAIQTQRIPFDRRRVHPDFADRIEKTNPQHTVVFALKQTTSDPEKLPSEFTELLMEDESEKTGTDPFPEEPSPTPPGPVPPGIKSNGALSKETVMFFLTDHPSTTHEIAQRISTHYGVTVTASAVHNVLKNPAARRNIHHEQIPFDEKRVSPGGGNARSLRKTITVYSRNGLDEHEG